MAHATQLNQSSFLQRCLQRFKGRIKEGSSGNYHCIVLVDNQGDLQKYVLKLSWLKVLQDETEDVVKRDIYAYLKNKYGIVHENIVFMVYTPPGSSVVQLHADSKPE